MADGKPEAERSLAFSNGGERTAELSARDDRLVQGDALATPRHRAEREIEGLLTPAAAALRRFLEADMSLLEHNAQSAGYKAQAELAMRVIDGCMGMVGAGEGRGTRSAAKILAAVGGSAVTAELQRRYAAKQRSYERQRFIEAVPAKVEAVQPMAAEADGGSVARETPAADGGDAADAAQSTGDT